MNIFIFALYIVGAVVFSVVVAVMFGVLLSILLYCTMATIRLIKGDRLFGEYLLNPLDDKSKCTKHHTENKGYAQYIKYFINDYFRLFWCHNKITNAIFYCLKKYAYTERHNERSQNVKDFPPIPFNEKPLDSIHCRQSIRGLKSMSTKNERYRRVPDLDTRLTTPVR